MRRTQLSVLIVFVLFVMAPPAAQATASRPSAEAGTARHLDTIRTSPAKLRAFLKAMPKGADLHNHLSGAVPTETLIGYAVEDGLCIETATFTATPAPAVAGGPCPAGQRPAADSSADAAFFAQIVRAWSMEDFRPGAESGHDHFFATFGKFALATSRKGDMLAEVAKINASATCLLPRDARVAAGRRGACPRREGGVRPELARASPEAPGRRHGGDRHGRER